MGRELRKVQKDWQHPKDEYGNYIPLLDGHDKAFAKWYSKNYMIELSPVTVSEPNIKILKLHAYKKVMVDNPDPQPDKSDYMPDWPRSERTHYQMYENTSEGTPISPVIESPESLARWLTDNKASWWADESETYENWLQFIQLQEY